MRVHQARLRRRQLRRRRAGLALALAAVLVVAGLGVARLASRGDASPAAAISAESHAGSLSPERERSNA